ARDRLRRAHAAGRSGLDGHAGRGPHAGAAGRHRLAGGTVGPVVADRRGRGRRGHHRLRADVRPGTEGAGAGGRRRCARDGPGAGRHGRGLMARPRVQYVCSACGGVSVKWAGQCPSCGEWNTLEETVAEPKGAARRLQSLAPTQPVVAIADVSAEDVGRMSTGSAEFDRVLGGGLVEGSVVLIGGDPGIGKSTLLLQALVHMSSEREVLYVSGEESASQIALRARRLGLEASKAPLMAETALERILGEIERRRPALVVVDSIQTVYSSELQSAPGSVAQVRECASQLTRLSKQSGIAIVMIGHVTKEGTLAGPRVLEHIVDTVLYFEGDAHSSYRLVRAFKNRFGAVNEL